MHVFHVLDWNQISFLHYVYDHSGKEKKNIYVFISTRRRLYCPCIYFCRCFLFFCVSVDQSGPKCLHYQFKKKKTRRKNLSGRIAELESVQMLNVYYTLTRSTDSASNLGSMGIIFSKCLKNGGMETQTNMFLVFFHYSCVEDV